MKNGPGSSSRALRVETTSHAASSTCSASLAGLLAASSACSPRSGIGVPGFGVERGGSEIRGGPSPLGRGLAVGLCHAPAVLQASGLGSIPQSSIGKEKVKKERGLGNQAIRLERRAEQQLPD